MTFRSILFEHPVDDVDSETSTAPACFPDLNLDQVVDAITAGREEYNLKPFFYHTLDTLDAIGYRHELFRDLENDSCLESCRKFSKKMQELRGHMVQAGKLHYPYQEKSWFLHAVEIYCEAVENLLHDLAPLGLKSRGFSGFLEYLADYAGSGAFTTLVAETRSIRAELARVRYCLLIQRNEVTVSKDGPAGDFGTEVELLFERFREGDARDRSTGFRDFPEMNHVEATILDLVAKLYPDEFRHLDTFRATHAQYLDATIARFDREIQFYLAYLEYVAGFNNVGLSFCLPRVSDTDKEVSSSGGFDLALATKLVRERKAVVYNDFCLRGTERIIVITGPNQGGKTTFARAFGQLHYLAGLGCPVPGKEARLFLSDRIFTHFEREEDPGNLRSKLEDDLERIHAIFTKSTSRSIVIINEMFTSTTVQDALFLGRKVLGKAAESDMLCVYVTFLDELTALPKTVSMVSMVVPDNPDQRTYKIERRPADGRSYAVAIARKNRLTYENILERISS